MTRGVLYLQAGTKCIPRLAVSIYSLRKYYQGPVTVLLVGLQPVWLPGLLKQLGVDYLQINDAPPVRHALCYKTLVDKWTPYDISVFLDADTLVRQSLDELFNQVEQHGLVVPAFSNWVTSGKKMVERIRACSKAAPELVKAVEASPDPAINTGVFGFKKGHSIFSEWFDTACAISKAESFVAKICDEPAMQLLYKKHGGFVVSERWNWSVVHGLSEDPAIIHYHGRKHLRTKFSSTQYWLEAYWALMRSLSKDFCDAINSCPDIRLREYLETLPNDVTLVTAIDPKYIEQLRIALPVWNKVRGLVNLPMLCFVNGMGLEDPRLDFLKGRAELVAWNPEFEGSQRAKMLAAFVLGAAAHVKTKHWVKIDCDQVPHIDIKAAVRLDLGDYQNSVISAREWGFTKPGSWLCDLEEWASTHIVLKGTEPLFTAEQLKVASTKLRYGHPRIISRVCVHNSEFVRNCAAICGGAMPVPSHDTYLWYCAARLGFRIDHSAGFKQTVEENEPINTDVLQQEEEPA